MGWLGPLDGGSWWKEASKSDEQKRLTERARNKAEALELSKTHTRREVAEIMDVAPSTVGKWLGPARSNGVVNNALGGGFGNGVVPKNLSKAKPLKAVKLIRGKSKTL